MTDALKDKKICELEKEIARLNGIIEGLQTSIRLSTPVYYPQYQQPTIEPYPTLYPPKITCGG